ncbi:cleft lip and palate transmembrane protein 1-like protein [Nematostella vectensis]|uniref:cleft lip and palate transmembrane protein 1-like protein n=1 Tax=Nematostella vectensis TaxID=45351 RepID=UPI0020778E25|nr:cleft lip and palate transmembrane protein 1-like protein [Nematostella vectensis]
MFGINLTTIALTVFGLYMLNSVYVVYNLFYVPSCRGNSRECLHPHSILGQNLELALYTSTQPNARSIDSLELLWKKSNFDIFESFTEILNASIPRCTRNNGSLYITVYVYPVGQTPFRNNYMTSYASSALTTYAVPKDEVVNLLSGGKKSQPIKDDLPVSHWRPTLNFHVMSEKVAFNRYAIPGEIFSLLRVTENEQYLPIVYIDELQVVYRHIQPLNKTSRQMPLNLKYSPISLGKLRIWSAVHQSMGMMKNLGFKDKDLDEIRGLFTDTNLYLLGLTFLISIFHLLFDFLAFKNDVNFWQNADSMVGLSSRTVIWRCVCSIIIFLYLMDEKASLLVLFPQGIGSIIEMWKLTKALKVTIIWRGAKPTWKFGERSTQEKQTDEFDGEALYYLKYVMYPLVVASAVYSLLYHPQKSWYSWTINSLVNGIYVLGFLFMMPQLFVNYRLKSVAHLPWRAFMYKAFNTFIDDVFAFIITMPTAHRLACFRDDFIFVIYLYQRWLYPVDMARVNEFGVSYAEEKQKQDKLHAD